MRLARSESMALVPGTIRLSAAYWRKANKLASSDKRTTGEWLRIELEKLLDAVAVDSSGNTDHAA